MADKKLEKIKLSVLNDALQNIKVKQSRNKNYIKIDLFTSGYYNESFSELDLLEITDYVVECIIKAGYKIDLDKNRIYWE